jgi:hypothetical protein
MVSMGHPSARKREHHGPEAPALCAALEVRVVKHVAIHEHPERPVSKRVPRGGQLGTERFGGGRNDSCSPVPLRRGWSACVLSHARATSLSSLCLPLVYLASVAFAQVIHAGAAVLAVSVDKVDAVAVNGQATVAQVRYQRGAIRTTGHAVQFLAADWPAQHDGKCA